MENAYSPPTDGYGIGNCIYLSHPTIAWIDFVNANLGTEGFHPDHLTNIMQMADSEVLGQMIGSGGSFFKKLTEENAAVITYIWHNREANHIELWVKENPSVHEITRGALRKVYLNILTRFIRVINGRLRSSRLVSPNMHRWISVKVQEVHFKNVPQWIKAPYAEIGINVQRSFFLHSPPPPPPPPPPPILYYPQMVYMMVPVPPAPYPSQGNHESSKKRKLEAETEAETETNMEG